MGCLCLLVVFSASAGTRSSHTEASHEGAQPTRIARKMAGTSAAPDIVPDSQPRRSVAQAERCRASSAADTVSEARKQVRQADMRCCACSRYRGCELCSSTAAHVLKLLSYYNPFNERLPAKMIMVARHKEDTSWLDVYLSDIPHVVYQVRPD